MRITKWYASKILWFLLKLTSKQIIEYLLQAKSVLVSDLESIYAPDGLSFNDQAGRYSLNSDWKRVSRE